ncbi:MAG: glycosyltransferase family 2 protein, partial [Eggerthellaceae bacterium]|nr:glycosyltransferase family 2 protein [Eggerthellaceae bacterium]
MTERDAADASKRPSVALSVLVPIYNAERYLDQCLDSLRAQTFADLEVVAIDDGSTDASPSILARHAAQDGLIRVIAKRNTGYGDSMNRGIEAARGQWVGLCEPDDFVDARQLPQISACLALDDTVVAGEDAAVRPFHH